MGYGVQFPSKDPDLEQLAGGRVQRARAQRRAVHAAEDEAVHVREAEASGGSNMWFLQVGLIPPSPLSCEPAFPFPNHSHPLWIPPEALAELHREGAPPEHAGDLAGDY